MNRLPGLLKVKPSSIPPAMRSSPANARTSPSVPSTDAPVPNIPVSTIFHSLSRNSQPWTLIRKLWSENPSDLQGEIKGIATFTPKHDNESHHGGCVDGDNHDNDHSQINELVYKEEGQTPAPGPALRGVAGMRWTKKYIWRLADEAEDEGERGIQVWFVKIPDGKSVAAAAQDERDYIFHNLDFSNMDNDEKDDTLIDHDEEINSSSPTKDYKTITARGHHLCVNDTYKTTYSFRLRNRDDGASSMDVIRWASKHVVTGPKKHQVITNVYHRE